VDPITRQPFPNNLVPPSRINPTALKIQNDYYPKANQGELKSQSNNYGFMFGWPSDLFSWNSTTDRIDHKFSDKNNFYARYINRITPYVLAGNFPNYGLWTRRRYHHEIVVSDTHIISPTLVNSARWGWVKDSVIDGDVVAGVTPVHGEVVVKNIGLQGVNP
jgi:hypothetical protein